MAKPRPLDEKFDEAYEQRTSIKPSVGGVRTSRVKVDLKNPHQRRDTKGRVVNPKKWRTDSTSQVVVSETKKTKKAEVVDLNEYREQQERLAAKESVVTGTRASAKVVPLRQPVARPLAKTKKNKKKKSKTKKFVSKRIGRLKAATTNTAIMAWLVPSYFFVQLPFALLNLIFLGMSYVVLSLTEEDDMTIDEETGVIGTITNFFWEGVKLAATAFNEAIEFLTGFDFLGFVGDIPQMGYMLTVSILFGYALFTLLTMGILYLFAGLKPLSGKGSTSKKLAVMMCLIGYFAPFFNLFPWAVFWAITVWKNPK